MFSVEEEELQEAEPNHGCESQAYLKTADSLLNGHELIIQDTVLTRKLGFGLGFEAAMSSISDDEYSPLWMDCSGLAKRHNDT